MLSLSNYLFIAVRGIVGLIPFSRLLAICEIQVTESRIRTRNTVSIVYEDNHIYIYIYIYISILEALGLYTENNDIRINYVKTKADNTQ